MQLSSQLQSFYAGLAPKVAAGTITFYYQSKEAEVYHYSTLAERSRFINDNAAAIYYTILPKTK